MKRSPAQKLAKKTTSGLPGDGTETVVLCDSFVTKKWYNVNYNKD